MENQDDSKKETPSEVIIKLGPDGFPVESESSNTEGLEQSSEAAIEEVPPAVEFKIPGPPPLADLLDLGIEAEIQKEEKERLKGKIKRFPLSPSKFGSCRKLLAMELAEFMQMGMFPLELFDAKAKKRFSRGYDIEYSMMKQLKKYVPIDQGFGQQYVEMDLTPDGKYVIGGSLDTLFITAEAMITDIKSKADYWSSAFGGAFEETFANIGRMPGVREFGNRAYFIEDIDAFHAVFNKDDFMSRYFEQLNAYGCSPWARNFRSNLFPGSVGIKAVSLLFENKNNHMNAEIRWTPSTKLYDQSIQNMKDVYQWVVIDKKPADQYKMDFVIGSLACRLCPRKAACWGDARHPYNGPKKKWATDTNRVANMEILEAAYLAYKNALTAKVAHDNLEIELIKEMVNSGEQKLRFPDGDIYEVKELKSPKPHFELRRSK